MWTNKLLIITSQTQDVKKLYSVTLTVKYTEQGNSSWYNDYSWRWFDSCFKSISVIYSTSHHIVYIINEISVINEEKVLNHTYKFMFDRTWFKFKTDYFNFAFRFIGPWVVYPFLIYILRKFYIEEFYLLLREIIYTSFARAKFLLIFKTDILSRFSYALSSG